MSNRQNYERFSEISPVTAMVRGILEFAVPDSFIDEIFTEHAVRQRSGELLFSTVVELMNLVVCRASPSIHAAYKQRSEPIQIAIKSIYNKLNGVETQVSRALVRCTAERLSPVIKQMKGGCRPLLPGYQVRILDGNHLPATEHRLKELRTIGSGPLPGQALVAFDPDQMLVTDVFPCEDAHTQERKVLLEMLEIIQAGQLWIADRNFCTSVFLWETKQQQAFFLVRQHATNVRWEAKGPRRKRSRSAPDDATLYETPIWIYDDVGQRMEGRRITVVLDKPTRNGEKEIHLLTNLPKKVRAAKVASLYRQRWTIEAAFGELATAMNNEINTLGYPGAALLGFCVGLLAYNIMSVVKAALRRVHGQQKVAEELSGFFLAEEVRATWKGMLIVLPPEFWKKRFGAISVAELARELLRLARLVQMRCFQKSPRGPKKPRPARSSAKGHPHVATARIIAQRKAAS